MKHLILVRSDLFTISARVRKINKNLCVFLNRKTGTFQIYSKKGISFLFETDLGKSLNQKALAFVQKNRIENLKKIVEMLDRENMKKEKEEKDKSSALAKDMFHDLISFADRKNDDVDFSKIKIGGRNDS